MTDAYGLLGLPRRPVVDAALLKKRYLALAAQWHPDAAEGDAEKFRALQDALRTLEDPSLRLRYLLKLEFDDYSGGSVQADGTLFMTVGSAIQTGRQAAASWQSASSPIVRAGLTGAVRAAGRKWSEAVALVDARKRELEEIIEALDRVWPAVDPAAVAAVADEGVYLARWGRELREVQFAIEQAGGLDH